MRAMIAATLLTALAAPAFAGESEYKGPVYEPNTYRFGGTYASESVTSATACSNICGEDLYCKAWSFVKISGNLGGATCELKHTTGRAEPNPTSTSGISPRIEGLHLSNQPSYTTGTTLRGGVGGSASLPTTTSRRGYVSPRPAPSAPAVVQSSGPVYRTAPRSPAIVKSSTPTYRAAPAAPATVRVSGPVVRTAPTAAATVTSRAPVRLNAPAAPATITSTGRTMRTAPAAPATVSSSTRSYSNVPAAPATVTSRPAPVSVSAPPPPPTRPVPGNSAPSAPVTFKPVAPSAKPYVPTKPVAVSAPAPRAATTAGRTVSTAAPTVKAVSASTGSQPSSRVVLTGDPSTAVNGRVVIGGTAAANLRPAEVTVGGERVPYQNIGDRDYSVRRAAEGQVESVPYDNEFLEGPIKETEAAGPIGF